MIISDLNYLESAEANVEGGILVPAPSGNNFSTHYTETDNIHINFDSHNNFRTYVNSPHTWSNSESPCRDVNCYSHRRSRRCVAACCPNCTGALPIFCGDEDWTHSRLLLERRRSNSCRSTPKPSRAPPSIRRPVRTSIRSPASRRAI